MTRTSASVCSAARFNSSGTLPLSMMTSAFVQGGIRHADVVLHEMSQWMEEHEYESVKQMRGSMSQLRCADPSAFERAQYMRAIKSYQPA